MASIAVAGAVGGCLVGSIGYRYFVGPKRRKVADANIRKFHQIRKKDSEETFAVEQDPVQSKRNESSAMEDFSPREDAKLLADFVPEGEKVFKYEIFSDESQPDLKEKFCFENLEEDDELLDLESEPVSSHELLAANLNRAGERGFVEVSLNEEKKATPPTTFKAKPPHDKRQDYIYGIFNASC